MNTYRTYILCVLLTAMILAGCQKADSAPTHAQTEASPSAKPTPGVTATLKPSSTATRPPTATATPTARSSETHTATPTTTPTPKPSLVLLVVDRQSSDPLPEAGIEIIDSAGESLLEEAAGPDGKLVLTDLDDGTYTLTLTMAGYQTETMSLSFPPNQETLTVNLTPTLFAEVTANGSNMRSGPGTFYPVVETGSAGQQLTIVGQSEDGQWLVVETESGNEAWISASLVDVPANLSGVSIADAPPTPTPTATSDAPAPVAVAPIIAAAPPTGVNLLYNPDVEMGFEGWIERPVKDPQRHPYCSVDVYPSLVYSGQYALYSSWNDHKTIYQFVHGVTPGVTYRLGAWVRYWSSEGDDRSISVNPEEGSAYICINVEGHEDRWMDSTFCSPVINDVDTWHYLTVDAEAVNETITVIMVMTFPRSHYLPQINRMAAFDDLYLGLATVSVTPTPAPTPKATRPDPVPFDGAALRDSMNQARGYLDQMGGMLDRLINGEISTCDEYQEFRNYYYDLMRTATYDGVPGDWQGVYNEYIFAVENGLATNQALSTICDEDKEEGQNRITWLNFTAGRTGVNDSLNRLLPAIETANALLGG